MPAYQERNEVPSVEREALHSETVGYAKRLSELNLQLDNLLTRLNGPRPSQVGSDPSGKNTLEPCLRDMSRRVGQEIVQLEQHVRFVIDTIG